MEFRTHLHNMSRPVSVEDLILQGQDAGKPKFISKKKRDLLKRAKIEKPVPHKRLRTNIDLDEPAELDQPRVAVAKKKPTAQSGKYSFDWDPEDDTLLGYQPLVTLDVAAKDELQTTSTHWSDKPLDKMTPRDWRIFRDDFSISCTGPSPANPLRRWNEEELLPVKLQDVLTKTLKYNEPTPIQRAAVPIALHNQDVVGVAETGSGKTLAYLLPLLAYLLSIEPEYMKFEHSQESNSNKALGLVVAPTRELAIQIASEAQKFADSLGYNVVTIIGGHQYEETVHSLRNGVHIVVATPGRLVDSLERGFISLDKCYHLTMDEADKMIDMGFEKSLQLILLYLPTNEHLQSSLDSRIFRVSKRTTLMFTATISPAVQKITKNYLVDPAYLYIGSANELVDSIEQKFEYMGAAPPDKQHDLDSKRLSRLIKVLEQHARSGNFSVIIFANYKRVVELLADELSTKKFGNVAVIHGSKSQEARERAIETFRTKSASILIATDVAARGLDVPHVSLVVNFHMSNKFEEYIHRIGRTGRAGQLGESFTFVDDGDAETFGEMKKFLSRGGYKIPEWLYSATRY